jgi:hypothetical protein
MAKLLDEVLVESINRVKILENQLTASLEMSKRKEADYHEKLLALSKKEADLNKLENELRNQKMIFKSYQDFEAACAAQHQKELQFANYKARTEESLAKREKDLDDRENLLNQKMVNLIRRETELSQEKETYKKELNKQITDEVLKLKLQGITPEFIKKIIKV